MEPAISGIPPGITGYRHCKINRRVVELLDLGHLRCFKAVAESQNMVKAGEILHIGQPAISKIIKNLEEAFGMQFFDRHGKNIILNQNGKILLGYATAALAAMA